ncbi:uncharacterized protein CDAR_302921 [Caerostris darwini]|uniref:Uncharacterized protein n=1 Tax=Caerostris darwini TaxID=1538125 RepID=A0AAV4V3C7_9ARAC|nr:uncharacterized protein CDAR_302921 [Caerostris darwini]
MWPHFDLIFRYEGDLKQRVAYYNLIKQNNLKLEDDSIVSIKKKIDELMGKPTTRNEGLILLYNAILQNSSFFVENWGQIIMGSLMATDSFLSKELVLKVLNEIITNFSHEHVCQQSFQKIIPLVMPLLLNMKDEPIKHTLHTLALCMKNLPDLLGNYVPDIEKFLVKQLSNSDTEVVLASAECFATLPLCVAYSEKGKFTLREMWKETFLKALNTIEIVLNGILKNKEKIDYIDCATLPHFKVPIFKEDETFSDEDCSILPLIKIFGTLCQWIGKMLRTEACTVDVPVSELFGTFQRIFSIEEVLQINGVDKPRYSLLKLSYPLLLNSSFIILEALISNIPMIEENDSFVKFMLRCLDVTKILVETESVKKHIRGCIWKLLSMWLKRCGSKGVYELITNETLINEVLLDIDIDRTESFKPKIESNFTYVERGHKEKAEACAQGLKVLKNLIQNGGGIMSKNYMDRIWIEVLNSARYMTLILNSSKVKQAPYSDELCRKMLLEVLLTCSVSSNPLNMKNIILSQNMFKLVSNKDTSLKVFDVCNRANKWFQHFFHPRTPLPRALCHPKANNKSQSEIIENIKSHWDNSLHNGLSADDRITDAATTTQRESVYCNMENEADMMSAEQLEDNSQMTHHSYRKQSSQSDESLRGFEYEPDYDEIATEPSYIPGDSLKIAPIHTSAVNVQSSEVEQSSNAEMKTDVQNSEDTTRAHGYQCSENEKDQVVEILDDAVSEKESSPVKPLKEDATISNGLKEYENEEIDDDAGDEGDEEDEDEEEEEEEDEEENENQSNNRYTHESDDERAAKRPRISTEEEQVDEGEEKEESSSQLQSDDEENEEAENDDDIPRQTETSSQEKNSDESQGGCELAERSSSPTITEMCEDLVLAEPTEIS